MAIFSFSAEDLMAKACEQTGLSDWGDASFLEPLEILLASYNNEAKLNSIGLFAVEKILLNSLCNRLKIHNELKQRPAIKKEKIKKPLIIVSLPRTGTTLLQRLLACDPANRSPLTWELLRPAPSVKKERHKTDPRIALAKQDIEIINRNNPAFQSIHKMDAMAPEECFFFHRNSFLSPSFQSETTGLPGYIEWLGRQDMVPLYEYQLTQLQILQYQHPTGRWLLKYPEHMYALDALLAVFPDACIVQILRDPTKSIPSLLSMISVFHSAYNETIDMSHYGIHLLGSLRFITEKYIKTRQTLDPKRFYDIEYEKLLKDPVSEVRKLYEYFNYNFDSSIAEPMRYFLLQNPKNKYGKHEYTMQDFGLSKDLIYSNLQAFYKRFELPMPE